MADTVINTLYPPIVETYQPAFIYTEKVPVTFSISDFNTINDITRVHVSIVDQRNNSNVLKTSLPFTSQLQEDTPITSQYGIVNGILIADIPVFETQIDTQQIGLFQYDPKNNIYAVNLDPEWLNRGAGTAYWNNNQYYQVQIRFDNSDNELTSNYLLGERAHFSEWSSITLIKPILQPEIIIQQLDSTPISSSDPFEIQIGNFSLSGSIDYNYTDTETQRDGISIPETERLQAYRIVVIDENDSLITDSQWVYAKQNLLTSEKTMIDYLLDFSDMAEGTKLKIRVYGRTNNGYVWYKTYPIIMTQISQSTITNVRWNNKLTEEWPAKQVFINQEDGNVEIHFQAIANQPFQGVFYFRRARLKSDSEITGSWDLIYCQECSVMNTDQPINIDFQDNTVSSLCTYRYRVQLCRTDGPQNIWEQVEESGSVYPEFYDMLLTRKDKQIAIRYNGQISSWKPTVNRQKIDTLGGRYPKFVENAAMNYKTFQISGLISAEEDFNRKFLNEIAYQYDIDKYHSRFGSTLLLRNDTDADGEIAYPDENQIHGLVQTGATKIDEQTGKSKPVYETINGKDVYSKGLFSGQLNKQHDSYPHNHWFWERTFREELVAWLNDGEPKLYRSMPEGNIAVMLTDINLTPNTQLGRMLYNFSATMYEVADGNDLDQLNTLGIIDIPKIDSIFINGVSAEGNISEDNITANIGEIISDLGFTQINSSENDDYFINGSVTANENLKNVTNYKQIWNVMSVQDRLNEKYKTKQEQLQLVTNSIEINGATLQFVSSPHYFQLVNDSFVYTPNQTDWLGYVFYLTQKDQEEQQIFVNRKGFYHIPSDITITNLRIPSLVEENTLQTKSSPQIVNVIYKYSYIRRVNENTKAPIHIILNRNFIGQYNRIDSLPLGANIISLIYANHTQNLYQNGEDTIGQIRLAKIKGLSLELPPYTYFTYKYNAKDVSSLSMLIGETGVFNSFEDWQLESLMLYGRRFTKVKDYPSHIEEWNFFTPIQETPQITDFQLPVVPATISINGRTYKDIEKQWPLLIENWNQNEDWFLSKNHLINEIGAPRFNTVYGFIKSLGPGNKQLYYQIYYIDGNWYPTIFLDETTVLAAVPIYGVINYHGELEKVIYNA